MAGPSTASRYLSSHIIGHNGCAPPGHSVQASHRGTPCQLETGEEHLVIPAAAPTVTDLREIPRRSAVADRQKSNH